MLPAEIAQSVKRIQVVTGRQVADVMAGAYLSVFKGRGMEFDEVRPYVPGDDVRSIDWNVTARTGEPFIKRFVGARLGLSRSAAHGPQLVPQAAGPDPSRGPALDQHRRRARVLSQGAAAAHRAVPGLGLPRRGLPVGAAPCQSPARCGGGADHRS